MTKNSALRDSIEAVVSLARLACFFFALFDLVGFLWFLGSTWPTPFLALLFAALAPKGWFGNSWGVALSVILYVLACAVLIGRIGEYWITGTGTGFSFSIDSVEVVLLTVALPGRIILGRLEDGEKNVPTPTSETPK